ncbi:hypothetical protein, conserved [Eimeria acervulina]|uniref:Uncharacterized protein n=1 Tax=Eimeria acervulina TaxID=5801 RepID=U6GD89_EIMAC|nr:hypothetical protein, conserved [Eimeria acervulina]CDI77318.1 hypothetical protein, conserved [Eimeria acervulina]
MQHGRLHKKEFVYTRLLVKEPAAAAAAAAATFAASVAVTAAAAAALAHVLNELGNLLLLLEEMGRAEPQQTALSSTVLPANQSSFSSLESCAGAVAAAAAEAAPNNKHVQKGWPLTVDSSSCAAAAAAVLSGCPYTALAWKEGGCPATAAAAAAAAAAPCCHSDSSILADGCMCGSEHHLQCHQQQLLQQQQLAQLFSCCDTTSVDGLLLGLLAKITAEHPQLLQGKFLAFKETTEKEHYPVCVKELALKTAEMHHHYHQQQQQQQQLAALSNSSSQRIVMIGLECSSSSRQVRLLRWARRHLLRSGDVVVLVSCWELARDPKYVRVPGMILAATSAAGAYNRQQQQQVQQRLRDLAESALKGLHVYCLAVPIMLQRLAAAATTAAAAAAAAKAAEAAKAEAAADS